MENRETITVETPVGKTKVVLKAYLTGREKRDLMKPFLRGGLVLDQKGGAELKNGMNSDVIEESENMAFRTVIVSVDGKKDGEIFDSKTYSVVDAVLDMHGADYSFLVTKINELTKDAEFEKKKMS